jgi:CheY-like chemotaxis protein
LPVKILCADDNEWIGGLYQQILARSGHQVHPVTDGQAAWDCLSADLNAFDLVILDFQMPWLSGLEIVKRLRRDNYRGKIVVQSGFLTPDLARQLEAFKVDRIVHKPIGFETITNLVAELA